MRNTVTTATLPVFTAAEGTSMTFTDITVLMVRMTAAQVSAWKWIGDAWTGTDPVEGYEVRDTTGALLGVVLPLGHRATSLHAEWYDPTTGDFYAAGETSAAVMTQGIARVLDAYARGAGPVPAGTGFELDEPRYLPARVNCWTGLCPEDCPECEDDHQRREADRLQYTR